LYDSDDLQGHKACASNDAHDASVCENFTGRSFEYDGVCFAIGSISGMSNNEPETVVCRENGLDLGCMDVHISDCAESNLDVDMVNNMCTSCGTECDKCASLDAYTHNLGCMDVHVSDCAKSNLDVDMVDKMCTSGGTECDKCASLDAHTDVISIHDI